jgi:hypothetical protein
MIELLGMLLALHSSSNNAPEFLCGEFKRKCCHFNIRHQASPTEANSPWQNRAESAMKEVKVYAHSILESPNVPICVWCFAYQYAVLSLVTATDLCQLGGQRTPYELVIQYTSTPDISQYVVLQFYINSATIGMKIRKKRK